MNRSSYADVDLPDAVRQRAIAASSHAWLDALPNLITELCSEWQLTRGRTYREATEAFVADVTRADGSAAVLKILLPSEAHDASQEIAVLRLAGGVGCPQLFTADEARGALLLERLGRAMAELDLSLAERRMHLTDAARQLWRRSPQQNFTNGAAKGFWLKELIEQHWQKLGQPCSRIVIDHALQCADQRIAAHHARRAVLVHGDIHAWNALEGSQAAQGASRFKLVDPDGLYAEAEYDLGVILREDPEELLQIAECNGADGAFSASWQAARELSVATNCDPTAIWQWAFIERISTGLVCNEIGVQPVGSDMLSAAEAIVSAGTFRYANQ